MDDVGPKTTAELSKPAQRLLDREIIPLAVRQHGVVALAQLVALGLSASAVRNRVKVGRLYRVHRGVFALSPQLTRRGQWMAAVLACGPGTVLSHRGAAALLGLRSNSRVAVDVIAPGRSGRSRAGIVVHRAGTLLPEDTGHQDGIPCTTLPRTLLDLAEVVDRRQLEYACRRAEALRLFDLEAIARRLESAAGRRGVKPLRAILAQLAPTAAFTRNELERRFLAICKRAGLPRPDVNCWLELPGTGSEIDFAWPGRRLAVETDGYETHGTRSAFEEDRRKDQLLAVAGWRAIRFSWRQVIYDPGRVETVLRAMLAD